MKSNAIRTVAAAALLAALAAPAFAQNIAIVNGKAIPSARLKAVEGQLERMGRPVSPEVREQLKKRLIDQEVLAQAAEQAGVTRTPEYKAGMEDARQMVLINGLREQYLKANPVTEADAKAEYDRLVAAQSGDEYRAHHILVEKEGEAKDLIAKIKAGGNFEELAKQHSKDPGSGARGGDLDWAPASAYVGEFGTALKALNKGDITQTPVKTQFGYHVIRLDDKRASQAASQIPPFEQVQAQVKEQLQQQKLGAYMKKLIDGAKVQ
ncbi:peptidylprolyl isomerase [Comamonas serinivorans]|uniref:peptidylprolyl isomerase n=1 Tax=Comamonas serinivorans TaxID=1082851 RepID=A0A1Y0EPU4_9BURK|nr:peptidylprolyl isomerase [Comamonas serinivorans]ARU05460.1 peptidylprolyl isomerase [Comamonas serinivorans]